MKNKIPADIYYELLEWKDNNSVAFIEFTTFISRLHDKSKVYSLNELNVEELKILYYCIHKKEMPMGQDGVEEFKLGHN